MLRRFLTLLVLCGASFLPPAACDALSPDEIAVVVNLRVAQSVTLARYYMEKRRIPDGNLIFLWVTDKETIGREAYEGDVASQIRRQLKAKDPSRKIKCLVTMYGVPLKISGTGAAAGAGQAMAGLSAQRASLISKLEEGDIVDEAERELITQKIAEIETSLSRKRILQDTGAALDSELSLVLSPGHDIGAWIANPHFVGGDGESVAPGGSNVLMVSRLDGPTVDTVRRIVDDSLRAESRGLTGVAYLDARWADPGERQVTGYSLYDRSIHRTAKMIRQTGKMRVVLEVTSELFAPGQCEAAALYCGWYRLARYVDAFEWQTGAVGYHIASAECSTLRKPESQVWCKRMLEEGVAATIGPVGEPYVQSFPPPEIFFKYLTAGDFSLAECYILSTPYLSWKQVLVGDPLYRPFKAEGKIR